MELNNKIYNLFNMIEICFIKQLEQFNQEKNYLFIMVMIMLDFLVFNHLLRIKYLIIIKKNSTRIILSLLPFFLKNKTFNYMSFYTIQLIFFYEFNNEFMMQNHRRDGKKNRSENFFKYKTMKPTVWQDEWKRLCIQSVG